MLEPILHRACRGVVGEDPEPGKFLQTFDSGGMVAVLMSEEDGVDAREGFANSFEHGAEPARGKTRIDQHARVLGDEQRRIARTAAAENAKSHRHLDEVR